SPGRTSGISGHHYANGTNHFWPCLHLSGFTPRQLLATEDSTLPEMYNLGLTNLVERTTISEAQLLNREMADSVPALLARIARWRPRVICFNGKGMWLHVELSLPSSPVTPRRATAATRSTFVYGIQPYKAVHDVVPKNATVRETLFCVFPSSSGRVVSHQRNDKVVLFKKLREDLELIKAGTFDTSSMQLVGLVRQGT
ncbi:uracil-DNA glycosylase-like protein, partial [Russula emetica]